MVVGESRVILPNWTVKMQAGRNGVRHRSIGYGGIDWRYVRQEDAHAFRPAARPMTSPFGPCTIVLRGRYPGKNAAGTIVETPTQMRWRMATDIAQDERFYPSASRLPHAVQR